MLYFLLLSLYGDRSCGRARGMNVRASLELGGNRAGEERQQRKKLEKRETQDDCCDVEWREDSHTKIQGMMICHVKKC